MNNKWRSFHQWYVELHCITYFKKCLLYLKYVLCDIYRSKIYRRWNFCRVRIKMKSISSKDCPSKAWEDVTYCFSTHSVTPSENKSKNKIIIPFSTHIISTLFSRRYHEKENCTNKIIVASYMFQKHYFLIM